ncbi:hypothetical protein MC885_006721 [Smutsia gigantea]|nr:hypothetical protein MC885_006721 [Smutsia gigantea]
MSAMIKIACVDTTAMSVPTLAMCLIIVLVLLPILVSYGLIAVAILKIKSPTGACLNTDLSNFPFPYIHTCTSSWEIAQLKLTLEPLIYTLRNKEFKGTMKKLIGKEQSSMEITGH